MIFVDTNVLLDIANVRSEWHGWSLSQLGQLPPERGLIINPIVVAELGSPFPTLDLLVGWLIALDIEVRDLDLDIAFGAGAAFREFRRRNRERDAMLSDFLIGAHAMSCDATLLTRDSRLYRRYFPDLTLITPETHPDG